MTRAFVWNTTVGGEGIAASRRHSNYSKFMRGS